jgi:glycosyltransferase involved in cell wall biosynthesis
MVSSPRFLVGTVGHNQHIGNIVRALYEADVLEAFYTGGVDSFSSFGGRMFRKLASHIYPGVDTKLARRRIGNVPSGLIHTAWGWESARMAARYLNLGLGPVDWVWERSEHALDRRCAMLLQEDRFSAYLGVEHGAASSIQAARALGKKTVVAFLSPHHSTRAQWVDPEFELLPQLLTPEVRKIRELAKLRDARRDEEARTADLVHCGSTFTAKSLIRAGLVTPERMMIVNLGCPKVADSDRSVAQTGVTDASGVVRFIWSGGVAVHKGIRVLLEAWKTLRSGHSAELHLYGSLTMPMNLLGPIGANVFFHGPVSATAMNQAYRSASALVFPTLCDGYGMVVPEAFANSLPVITTWNAGAADLVEQGRNGFIVPPGDVESLAERLAWCMDHPEDLRAMRDAARETAVKWSWHDFRGSFVSQISERLQVPFTSAQEIVPRQAVIG